MRATQAVLSLALVTLLAAGVLSSHAASLPAAVACSALTGFTGLGSYELRHVSFPSGRLRIGAFLQKPAGPGPFPAYIHTHGGIRREAAADARFWGFGSRELRLVEADYVVLRLARRGHFGSDGTASAFQSESTRLRVDQFEALLYEEAADVLAAFAFLSDCPFIDARRIAIGGHSTGGFITIIAAGRLPNAAAVASINGGISWSWDGEQQGWPATRAMHAREAPKIKAPVLVLIGSRDDQIPPDVGLSLAETLRRHGTPVEVRMYAGGHGDWPVDDLVRFLDRHLKEGRR